MVSTGRPWVSTPAVAVGAVALQVSVCCLVVVGLPVLCGQPPHSRSDGVVCRTVCVAGRVRAAEHGLHGALEKGPANT
jgi:hypothetical protein